MKAALPKIWKLAYWDLHEISGLQNYKTIYFHNLKLQFLTTAIENQHEF
jgi:hypothetical protein